MPALSATTILLVDDSPEDRHAYIAFLRANKAYLYTFLEADQAEDGLRIVRQAKVDCIILDYELPDMNGLEFLERLREEMPTDRPPVIMVTGRGSEPVAVAALRAGALDYLVKSQVSAQSVYRATHNALELGQLNRSLRQQTRERENAESELRESEARYRMLVESVREYAIMMLDQEGRITSWNAGARKLFGFHDYEVLGQHVRRLYPPEAVREREPELELNNARNAISSPTERWLLRKDGSRFFGGGALSPVFDHFGRLCGFSKVVRDVTDRIEGRQRIAGMLASHQTLISGLDNQVVRPLERLQKIIRKCAEGCQGDNGKEIMACVGMLSAVCGTLADLQKEAESREARSAATGATLHEAGAVADADGRETSQ